MPIKYVPQELLFVDQKMIYQKHTKGSQQPDVPGNTLFPGTAGNNVDTLS